MGGLTFRRWLSDRLLGTEYARAPIPDDRIDAVAKKIGVDPDLLVEVRMRARVLRATDGVQDPLGVKRAGTRHCQQALPMPKVVRDAWDEECEFRGLEGAAVLRSLIHAYLLGSREPTSLTQRWIYKGRIEPLPRPQTMLYAEKTLITNGAWRALHRRAQRFGASRNAIMRGLVLEYLAGGHRDLQMIDARMMYDDEDRYYLGGNVAD